MKRTIETEKTLRHIAYIPLRDAVIQFRGAFIDEFCFAESCIDNIIRRYAFDDVKQYDFYLNVFSPNNLRVEQKTSILSYCIDKFKQEYQNEIIVDIDLLSKLVEIRNKGAYL